LCEGEGLVLALVSGDNDSGLKQEVR